MYTFYLTSLFSGSHTHHPRGGGAFSLPSSSPSSSPPSLLLHIAAYWLAGYGSATQRMWHYRDKPISAIIIVTDLYCVSCGLVFFGSCSWWILGWLTSWPYDTHYPKWTCHTKCSISPWVKKRSLFLILSIWSTIVWNYTENYMEEITDKWNDLYVYGICVAELCGCRGGHLRLCFSLGPSPSQQFATLISLGTALSPREVAQGRLLHDPDNSAILTMQLIHELTSFSCLFLSIISSIWSSVILVISLIRLLLRGCSDTYLVSWHI